MNTRYYLCQDLGEVGDPTAIGVIDNWVKMKTVDVLPRARPRPKRVPVSGFDVRHLERCALGTPYIAPEGSESIIEKTKTMMSSPQLKDQTELVVDATAVGRAVIEMYRTNGLRPVPIVLHAGREVTLDDQGYFYVPKRDVVFALIATMQEFRLRIGPVPEAEILGREIQSFKMKYTDKGHDQYAAWREGEHDDLVLALCIGLWYARKMAGTFDGQLPPAGKKRKFDPLRD